MLTLDQIMTAMERLSAAGLQRVRMHLDRLERKVWEKDLDKLAAVRKRRGITDRQIDEMIMRRRRESRA